MLFLHFYCGNIIFAHDKEFNLMHVEVISPLTRLSKGIQWISCNSRRIDHIHPNVRAVGNYRVWLLCMWIAEENYVGSVCFYIYTKSCENKCHHRRWHSSTMNDFSWAFAKIKKWYGQHSAQITEASTLPKLKYCYSDFLLCFTVFS